MGYRKRKGFRYCILAMAQGRADPDMVFFELTASRITEKLESEWCDIAHVHIHIERFVRRNRVAKTQQIGRSEEEMPCRNPT